MTYSEDEIRETALKIIKAKPHGITTTDLILELETIMKPSGKDLEVIDGRSDTYFSQKVRNLVSHRNSGSGLSANGEVIYDKELRGWRPVNLQNTSFCIPQEAISIL